VDSLSREKGQVKRVESKLGNGVLANKREEPEGPSRGKIFRPGEHALVRATYRDARFGRQKRTSRRDTGGRKTGGGLWLGKPQAQEKRRSERGGD